MRHSIPYPELMVPAFVGCLFPFRKGRVACALPKFSPFLSFFFSFSFLFFFLSFFFLMRETLGPPNPQPDTFLASTSVPLYLTFPFSLEEEMPF